MLAGLGDLVVHQPLLLLLQLLDSLAEGHVTHIRFLQRLLGLDVWGHRKEGGIFVVVVCFILNLAL